MSPKIHSQNNQSGKSLNCYYNLAKSLLLLDCRTFFVSLSLRKQMLYSRKPSDGLDLAVFQRTSRMVSNHVRSERTCFYVEGRPNCKRPKRSY